MKYFENQTIIVPFDFSEPCVDAVETALKLAKSPADVHVVHVLQSLATGHPYSEWDEECEQKRLPTARSSMEEKLKDLQIENVCLDVAIGNAGNAVAGLAKEIDAGLIIIPSHGKRGVQRMLLGSVTERVVRLAPCPVLVLKHE